MSSQSISSSKPAADTKTLWRDVINCFRSIHLAIILLSLLAIGTIIGVVMPQEGMVELAEIEKRYGHQFEFLQALGFFNVYSSFWFITLQVLFFFNLLIGSFKWLKPATLAAIQKTFLPPALISTKPDAFSLRIAPQATAENLESKITETLKQFRYRVYQNSEGQLYACKGNITRLGPSIAHVGILLCLVAGVYSSFTGFKGLHMITPGNSFSISEASTLKTNTPEPLWMGNIPEWKIQVDDFQVEFYEDHPETAKQYYSQLKVISPQGEVLKEQTISVNHPLIYDNISIYQASFAPTGNFLLTVNGQPLTVEVNNQFNNRPVSLTAMPDGSTLIMFPFFAGQDPGVTENHAVFMLKKPNENLSEGTMPENIRLKEGASGQIKDLAITYHQPEMSTGLQIKRAPEVPLMYLSYLIISIGTLLCFFSQRQIWVALNPVSTSQHEIMLHPKTNKARLSFRKELLQIQNALENKLLTLKPLEKEAP